MEKLTYEEAVAEVEKILDDLENRRVKLENVEKEIERASDLLTYCRKLVKDYEVEYLERLNGKS